MSCCTFCRFVGGSGQCAPLSAVKTIMTTSVLAIWVMQAAAGHRHDPLHGRSSIDAQTYKVKASMHRWCCKVSGQLSLEATACFLLGSIGLDIPAIALAVRQLVLVKVLSPQFGIDLHHRPLSHYIVATAAADLPCHATHLMLTTACCSCTVQAMHQLTERSVRQSTDWILPGFQWCLQCRLLTVHFGGCSEQLPGGAPDPLRHRTATASQLSSASCMLSC